jgi:AcrR family transcriptional regulator
MRTSAPAPRPTAPRRNTTGTHRRAPEIIEAAARVFAERGYHGASTQAIADVLGIRQASLYYYFASKEEALEQVCMLGVEGFVERAAAIAGDAAPAAERIRRLVLSHLAPLDDRRDFVQVFLRDRHRLPDASRRRVGRQSRRLERIIHDVFDEGVRRGEFRADLDCRLATLALLGACNAVAAWHGKEPNAATERVGDEFATLLLEGAVKRGVAARPARGARSRRA